MVPAVVCHKVGAVSVEPSVWVSNSGRCLVTSVPLTMRLIGGRGLVVVIAPPKIEGVVSGINILIGKKRSSTKG